MYLNLGEPYEKFIQREIKAGLYNNATKLIRDAISRMQENKESVRVANIHALIDKGKAQIKKGYGIQYNNEFMDTAMKQAIENHNTGKPVKDEIKPRKS